MSEESFQDEAYDNDDDGDDNNDDSGVAGEKNK